MSRPPGSTSTTGPSSTVRPPSHEPLSARLGAGISPRARLVLVEAQARIDDPEAAAALEAARAREPSPSARRAIDDALAARPAPR